MAFDHLINFQSVFALIFVLVSDMTLVFLCSKSCIMFLESTGTVNGEVMVSGVVTSQQAAVKRRPNSKQDSTAASSQATNLKDFECPSGDRYTQHDSMLE